MTGNMSKMFLGLLSLALLCFLASLHPFVRSEEFVGELAVRTQAASVALAKRRLLNLENKFSEADKTKPDEEDYTDDEEGSEHKDTIAKVGHDGLVAHSVRSHD
jgi:hypothetical protein